MTTATAKWNQDWTSPTEVIVNRKPYYATRTIGESFGRPDIIIYTLTSGTILMQESATDSPLSPRWGFCSLQEC